MGALQRCHSAVAVGHTLLFFGGGVPGRTTHDVHGFDTRSSQWRHPRVMGRKPRRRQSHSAAIIADGSKMLVYGGALATNGQEELGDSFYLDLDAHADGVAKTEHEEEEDDEESEEEGETSVLVRLRDGRMVMVPRSV